MLIIFLLFTLLGFLQASSLLSYQTTLWKGSGSPKSSSQPTTVYTQTYPRPYNASYQRGLAFGGFCFDINNDMSFSANLNLINETADSITFNIQEDLSVYYISFDIILVDTSSPWLWMEQVEFTSFSTISTTGGSQYEIKPFALSRFATVGSMTNTVMLKDFRQTSAWVSSNIHLTIDSYTATTMSIKINRMDSSYRRIYRVSMVIIMADSGAYSSNSSIHFDTYSFYTEQTFALAFINIVGSYPSNFGIDPKYLARGTLDQQCMLGLNRIYGNYGQNIFYADMTTEPITKKYWTSALFYIHAFYYEFVCVLEFYSTQICANKYNFQNCSNCTITSCFNCLDPAFYHKILSSGSQDCVTNQCISLFNYTNCVECLRYECIECEANFNLTTINSTIFCVTLQCENIFNYIHCQECIQGQCLSCNNNFYFWAPNGTLTNNCVTQSCWSMYSYLSCHECNMHECLVCEPTFYFKNVTGLKTCVTQQWCASNYSFESCYECTQMECLQCIVNFYFKNVSNQEICVTDQCFSLFNYTKCVECRPYECIECETNFNLTTINSTIFCVTLQCENLFSYLHCQKCIQGQCLSCKTSFYFWAPNGTLTNNCVTQSCWSMYSYLSCHECNMHECLVCEPTFYFKNVTGLKTCVTQLWCASNYSFESCYECTQRKCLQCNANFYFKNVSNQEICVTQLCSAFTDCEECTLSTCITCEQNFTFEAINSISICVTIITCEHLYGFDNCAKCTSYKCLQCKTDFYLENNICRCIFGSPINGICNTIDGCIDPVVKSDGTKSCAACNTTNFKSDPVNDKCQCILGTLVNGVCNTIMGCIVPVYLVDGSVGCRFCNVTAKLNGTPAAAGKACDCQTYYDPSGSVCQEICGDGVLLSLDNPTTCDDGNIVDNDGCSSSCQVQDFFRCSNTDEYTPSVCLYSGIPMKLTTDYIQRSEEENQGTFVFDLTPNLIILNQMDFKEATKLTCGVAGYTLSDVEYKAGKIKLLVDFTEDLEGAACTLNIAYDQSITLSQNSSYDFQATSRNQKLIIFNDHIIQTKKSISFIFKYQAYTILVMFLVCIRHKTIWVQLVTACQVAYFSLAFYKEPTFLGSSIKSLNFVTGDRDIFYQQRYKEFEYPYGDLFKISPEFAQDNSIWLVVVGLLVIILIMIKVYDNVKQCCEQKNENKTKKKQVEEIGITLGTKMLYFYSFLLFPIIVFNLILTVFTLFVNSYRQDISGEIPQALSGLGILVSWFIASSVITTQLIGIGSTADSEKIGGIENMKSWYVPFFLLKIILFAVVLALKVYFYSGFELYIALGIWVLSIVQVLLYRPYDNVFDNLVLMIYHLTAVASLCLALVNNVIEIQVEIQAYAIWGLTGLIGLSILFTLVRICRYYYPLIKQKCNEKGLEGKKQSKRTKQKEINQQQNERFMVGMFTPYKNQASLSQIVACKQFKRANIFQQTNNMEQQQQFAERQNETQEERMIKERLRKSLIKKKKRQKEQFE